MTALWDAFFFVLRLAFSEWEYYSQTGDVTRLEQIFDPLLAYHLWLKEFRTWRDGTYWSTGWGGGMDNMPRFASNYNVAFSHGHMVWIDACIQQVLSAKILIQIADIIGRADDENVSLLKEEVKHLTSVINDKLWHEDDAFYYDLWKNGELNKVKSKLTKKVSLSFFWRLAQTSRTSFAHFYTFYVRFTCRYFINPRQNRLCGVAFVLPQIQARLTEEQIWAFC